jgi:glucose-1-phosphate adenylyltransferase
MPIDMPHADEFRGIDDVAAIILGGGRGTRLFPLTAERAKPAVPLCGRYRLIDIPISNCVHSKVNRILVMTQFMSASLNKHINSAYKFDNFSGGSVEILAAQQTDERGDDWFQGTADAVRKHLKGIMELKAKHYLILSGDQLYRMDYRTMLSTHLRHNAAITVGAMPVSREKAQGFGIMLVGSNGRIKSFYEKPTDDELLDRLVAPPKILERYGIEKGDDRQYLASMGVYIFSAEVLENILTTKQDWIDFGAHVIPRSLKNRRVFSHPFLGFWEDIGTVRSYYEVSMAIASSNPPFQFYDQDQSIFTNLRYLAGARIQGAAIKDSIICEGARITGATLTNTIVGIRTNIYRGSRVERSIVMGADYYDEGDNRNKIPLGIGKGSTISGAIIDKNARIGRNVTIRGSRRLRDKSGDGWVIRDGIVVVRKDATIPDGTRIG